jgi:hypothetical protein
MGSFTQREEIQELCDIVSPANSEYASLQWLSRDAPHIGVVALFPEACANGCALLLHDGPLIGNRLRGAHIPNELLHCHVLAYANGRSYVLAYRKSLWWPLGPHRGGASNVDRLEAASLKGGESGGKAGIVWKRLDD